MSWRHPVCADGGCLGVAMSRVRRPRAHRGIWMSDSGPPSSSSESSTATSIADTSPSTSPEATPPRPARETGTWQVGGWNPSLVKALTVIGFAVPVIGYLALLRHYQMDALVGDQWSDVTVISASYNHFPDWGSLWALHNGNRIL